MDYLPYKRTKYGLTVLYTLISVDLAHCEIFQVKIGFFWKRGIIVDKPLTAKIVDSDNV